MAGNSIQTDAPNEPNRNHMVSGSLQSNGTMPTPELGRNFARGGIEIASLAIRSAQTSLFPETASATFHNRRHEWRRHPLAPISPTSFASFRNNIRVNNNDQPLNNISPTTPTHGSFDRINGDAHQDNDDDDDDDGNKSASSRKKVTFNSDIDEIEISDICVTSESGSHEVDDDDDGDDDDEENQIDGTKNREDVNNHDMEEEEEDDEVFTLGADESTSSDQDHDSAINISMEEENQYNDENANENGSNVDNNDHLHSNKLEEDNNDTTVNNNDDNEDNDGPSKQEQDLIDGASSTSSTIPTPVDRYIIKEEQQEYKNSLPRDMPFTMPTSTNNQYLKEQRGFGDEVLTELTQPKLGNWHSSHHSTPISSLPPSTSTSTSTSSFHGGTSSIKTTKSNTTTIIRSVDNKLTEAINKAKEQNQRFRAVTPTKTQSMPSLIQHSLFPHREDPLGIKNNNNNSNGLFRRKKYAASDFNGSTTSLTKTPRTHSRMATSRTTQEPILLRSTPSNATLNTTTTATSTASSRGTNDDQDIDFGMSVMSELDRITSKRTTYYQARESNTVVHASKTLIDENEEINGRLVHENVSIVSAIPMEPIWREFGSFPERKHRLSPFINSRNKESKGRLYIHLVAAENLDFPIHSDAPQIRCVLSNGNSEQSTDFHAMKHNIQFDHNFYIDVEPSSEFTLTLVAGQPTTKSNNQFRKLLGNRRRTRTDSILRYVNRMDGAIAQTRVSLESIETQCRTKVCRASFALINGWYQYARFGGIIPTHKKDKNGNVPEKAVGKVTVELCYVPCDDEAKMEKLPINLDDCQKALNARRCHRTCWQSGCMSQLGGDVKFWRRRFFSLRGWRLYSYTDGTPRTPRVVIDLSQAISLAADHRIIIPPKYPMDDASSTTTTTTTANSHSNLLSLPQQQQYASSTSAGGGGGGDRSSIMSSATTASEDELVSYSVKNGYRITFKNGESIDFFCDSAKEREDWLQVLKAIINHVPMWPDWMDMDPDNDHDYDYTENNNIDDSIGTTASTSTHVPPQQDFRC